MSSPKKMLRRLYAFRWGVILWPALLMTARPVAAQNLLFPLDTFRQIVKTQVDVVRDANNILEDSVIFTGRLREISAYRDGVPQWDSTAYFVRNPLELNRGDLIIEYKLPETEETPEDFYEVSVAFRLNGQPIRPEPENLRGDVGTGLKGGPGKKTITWVNLLENYINISDTLEMELTIVLNGLIPGCLQVDCTQPPQFEHEPLLYYSAIGGAALIGIGQLFDKRSDDIYEDYLNPKLSQLEADELYTDANGKHKTYLTLTYVGTAILVADAVWLLFKKLKLDRKKRLYEECCRSTTVEWRPVMDIPSTGMGAYTGVQLKINF